MQKFIPISEPNISEKEIQYVTDAVTSGWVSSLGYYVETFEKNFAMYCGRKYGVSVSNGTVALHLALVAMDIKARYEIIVPNFSFAATINSILYTGATPVLADIEPDTLNVSVESLEKAVTKNTKAIMVVHTYGHPANMDVIEAFAKKHNIAIIEDAAEAHGAEYRGKRVGGFGTVSCFSFYGNKTITTGEGGMCLTDDEELYKKMLLLRDHGMRKEKKYWHEVVGYNYRITNLQAALGCAQLERINEFLTAKRKNAELYKELLKDVPWIILPIEKEYAKNSYWMFTILLGENAPYKRDELAQKLKEKNIDSRVIFYPISDMPPYQQYNNANLAVSKKVAYTGLSLPSSTKITEEEIRYICETIKSL